MSYQGARKGEEGGGGAHCTARKYKNNRTLSIAT